MNAKPNDNEIVKALHVLCGFDGKSCSGNCAACPADQFRKEHPGGACDEGTMTAAFALIESQAAEIKRYRDAGLTPEEIGLMIRAHNALREMKDDLLRENAASQRRERAAVEDIKRVPQVWPCYACKHTGQMSDRCHYDDRDCFEWRGPQEAGEGGQDG